MLLHHYTTHGHLTQAPPVASATPRHVLSQITNYANLNPEIPFQSDGESPFFPHLRRIEQFMGRGAKIRMILPAFPAKSPNPEKTLGPLPDQGEVLALKRLNQICENIQTIYAPGAEIYICSDGRVFSDLVLVDDKEVNQYSKGISEIIGHFKLSHLKLFNLEDVYMGVPYDKMRKQLVESYAVPLDTLRSKVKMEPDTLSLFNGIHRFLFEDRRVLRPQLSNNQIRKEAKAVSYEVIRRSNAWSQLVAENFPGAVRLSIHPQSPTSEKLGIQLLKCTNIWGTPWHGVVLWNGTEFSLVKRKAAIETGAALVPGVFPYFSSAGLG